MGYKFNPFTGTLDTVDSPIGSSGQVIYNNGGALAGISTLTFDGTSVTLAGRLINSYTSLASAPAKVLTGTWFTGGTSTTTKPHFLIEPTGTTSTAWSTSGTGLGVNAASGFNGRLLDLQTNGTSRMVVQGDGKVGIGTTSPAGPLEIKFGGNDNGLFITAEDDTSWGYSPNIYFRSELTNGADPGISGRISSIYESSNNFGMSFYTTTAGSNSEKARIDSSGRLGIATTTPGDKLEIGGAGAGIILASPDGTRYRLTVANGGTLSIAAV